MNDNLERYSIFLDKYVLTDSGHNFYSIKQEMLSLNHNKFREKMWKIKEGRKIMKGKEIYFDTNHKKNYSYRWVPLKFTNLCLEIHNKVHNQFITKLAVLKVDLTK